MLSASSTDLSQAELATIQTLRDPPNPGDADWEMVDDILTDVLDGNRTINISHEGGEFEALADLGQRIRNE
jgi:hypothetical protein